MDRTAFVLAAGLGTRLRPLTEARPKALVPVCGVPLLAYALALCRRHGLDRVVVNAHHHARQVTAWHGVHEGVDVRVSVETPEVLGTGGGLRHARGLLAERFAVVNADVLCDVDLTALLALVPHGGAAMALRPHADDARRYGVVAADATGTVTRLIDVAQAPATGVVRDDTHFTGVHAMDRGALALVPDGFACVVRSAYRTLVPQRRVRALRHAGTWLDVGDPAAYLAANLALLCTTLPVPLDPIPRAGFAVSPRGQRGTVPAGVRVEGSAWVGPGATVGRGVVLRDTVVGAGATIPEGAALERCVVWDGRFVPAGRWQNGVFHDGGWLHVPTASA